MLKPGFWQGRTVLVTGHTGFKGTWLAAWLSRMGAKVAGFALAPDDSSSPYSLVRPDLSHECYGDIRDLDLLSAFVRKTEPDIILHLAAQALVRNSYADPVTTFASNVMGTVHVLEAVRQTPSARTVLVITTDKVYENLEAGRPFVEVDRLGAGDPYSTSKACAELVTSSYRNGFFTKNGNVAVATARAGNVLGGGDRSADRIVPDLVRALQTGTPVRLRYPRSVRPWLHVLEPLAGYIAMAEAMTEPSGFDLEALNFAPDPALMRTVAQLVERFSEEFGGRPGWIQEEGRHPREAGLLTLDATAAKRRLGWFTRLDFDATIRWTAEWYREHMQGGDMRQLTFDQIDRYVDLLSVADEPRSVPQREQMAG